jgi:hypothetical protein
LASPRPRQVARRILLINSAWLPAGPDSAFQLSTT